MKKIALCIGNDDYRFLQKLKCAVADAQSVDQELKKLGFETSLELNLDRESFCQAVCSFLDKIESADVVLIYYAGHGFQIEGDNILLPTDVKTNDRPEAVKYNSYPLSMLMNKLKDYPDKTKIVILDACRDVFCERGCFKREFAPFSVPQGSVIEFSTSPGQSSKENTRKGHGYYTEALLKYLSLPRVPIEKTFKKVREFLYASTDGTQISWEHSSLVGDFYFNPDTIYDGAHYSKKAYADKSFTFKKESRIKKIVADLKSCNWYTQEYAINSVDCLDFQNSSCNELFVLGRNIYQAADGKCFACQRFIDEFQSNIKILNQAKFHILNGMSYEIYFNSSNQIRANFKIGFYQKVLYLLELPEFNGSSNFISYKLGKATDRLLYIPNQNEIMEFVIKTRLQDDQLYIDNILYQGRSVYSFDEKNSYSTGVTYEIVNKQSLLCEISNCVLAPQDMIKLEFDDDIDEKTHINLRRGLFIN